MHIPSEYIYLLASLSFLPIWLWFYVSRKDVRKEMLIMSLFIGVLSVITSYIWWTVDWWQPPTITGTRVGIEDFIIGFLAGGMMSVVYEELSNKRDYKMHKHVHYATATTILLLLAATTSFLIHEVDMTTFTASSIAMILASGVMFFYRHDLMIAGLISGVTTVFASLFPYYLIMLLDPVWIAATYKFEYLSGIMITGIPIEELQFWFLAGVLFGPFYEYWHHTRLRKCRN